MKFIFPPAWIIGFGIGTFSMWFGDLHLKNGSVASEPIKYQFLFMWFLGTAFILWYCTGLKKVNMDSKNLYVSNYFKEIIIPLSEMSAVDENRWINIHPVTIHLKSESEFGKKIVFMPSSRMFGFFSSHPIVSELRSFIIL